jgi:uncharacterized protein YjiS (DUF1127 family)
MAQYGYLDILTEAQAVRGVRAGNGVYKMTPEELTRYARGAAISDALVWLGHNVVLHPAALTRAVSAAPYRLTAVEKARYQRAETITDAVLWVWRKAAALASTLSAPIQRWQRRSAIQAELNALDDRTLADMGITRGDIPAIAAGLWAPERAFRSVVIPQAAARKAA